MQCIIHLIGVMAGSVAINVVPLYILCGGIGSVAWLIMSTGFTGPALSLHILPPVLQLIIAFAFELPAIFLLHATVVKLIISSLVLPQQVVLIYISLPSDNSLFSPSQQWSFQHPASPTAR